MHLTEAARKALKTAAILKFVNSKFHDNRSKRLNVTAKMSNKTSTVLKQEGNKIKGLHFYQVRWFQILWQLVKCSVAVLVIYE